MASYINKIQSVITGNLFLILQISTIALLLGRAWQFMSKSTPFSSFFYHTVFMNPVIKYVYRTNWKEYLNNAEWYTTYKTLITCWGIFLLLSIFVIIGVKKIPHLISKSVLFASFFLLFFLAFCYYIDKGFRLGQFVEYALQFSSPLIFWYYFKHYFKVNKIPSLDSTFVFFLKIVIALTFIGHALFAIGYYPIPGVFIDMIIKSFSVSEAGAKNLLLTVGVLDIVAALLLFIPWRNIQKIGLYYIIIWGFLTTVARIYANVSYGLGWYSVKQWMPEFLMRFPHFLIPVFLFGIYHWNSNHIEKG